MVAMYPCPCCGYDVFDEPPGSYLICPICFWEDDIVQLAFPDMVGGANDCSLIEGQKSYATCGACKPRMRTHVRSVGETDVRDSSWRPLKSATDRHLRCSSQDDHRLWGSVKNGRSICLYYWRPDYWLNQI
jgi:hypothetical protein